MRVKKFLQQARLQVSDNPRDRISSLVRDDLDQGSFVADCHSHLMTKRTLTRNYLLLRLIGAIDPDSSEVDDWLEGVIDPDQDNNIDLIVEILNQPRMEDVFSIFEENFAPAENSSMAALMMDLEFGLPVNAKQPIQDQVRELNTLAEEKRVLPFLAVDPRRAKKRGEENLYSIFLQAFGEGGHFAGVKCYPSLGYLPSHRALQPIFEICQEKNIPVTVHCGGTTISTIYPVVFLRGKAYAKAWRHFPVGRDWAQWFLRPIGRTRKEKAEFLNHPYHWKPVLDRFPRLKLNLGHMGGNDHWRNYMSSGSNSRLEQIAVLMEEFPGVYADISGLPLIPGAMQLLLENPPYLILRERALYGSDFWVNVTSGRLKESIAEYLQNTPSENRKKLEVNNPTKWLFDLH